MYELLLCKVRKLEGPRLRLHSSVIQPALEEKRLEVAWMEQRMGVSLEEDLTLHDSAAIRSEEELLRVALDARRWLCEQLGVVPDDRKYPRDHRALAWMVHKLHARVARADARKRSAATQQ